jgi:hypothetical protein
MKTMHAESARIDSGICDIPLDFLDGLEGGNR